MNIDTINYPNGTKLVVTPRTTTFIDKNGKPILLDRKARALVRGLVNSGMNTEDAYERTARHIIERENKNKRIDVC